MLLPAYPDKNPQLKHVRCKSSRDNIDKQTEKIISGCVNILELKMIDNLKLRVKRALSAQKGQALVLVLVLVLLAGLIIAPLLNLMGTGIKTNSVFENRTAYLYAADAGVQDAVWQLKHGNFVPTAGFPATSPALTVNGKTENVTISLFDALTPVFKIVAVSGTVTVTSYVAGGSGISLFSNALCSLAGNISASGGCSVQSGPLNGAAAVFAVGSINLSPSAFINGSAYATSSITLGSSTAINGTATATGTIGGTGTVSGAKTPGAPTQTPPAFVADATVQNVYNETFNIPTLSPLP
jgi:Tfp pilus assembly protein PilX